ncbi:MAG: cell division protein ZapA [Gemmatimonadota bacterium]|jgi:cell division protein ZapA (FtsZ GTPase activity inhibitor)
MSGGAKTIVTVEIAGEEYTIRSEASPDYTLQCACYLDETISQIERQSGLVEVQKAVILAALSLTDQLFQARAEADALRRDLAALARDLAEGIESRLGASDLASET